MKIFLKNILPLKKHPENTGTVRSGFTLIELVAVLAIAVLVTGIVVVNVGRMPAFISLDNTAHRIQYLFSKASMMAAAQGVVVNVSYSDKVFSIDRADASDTGAAVSMVGLSGSETIPEAVELEFDEQDPKYIFFPDGTGSGTSFNMTLKGHVCRIRISPLTGYAVLEFPEAGAK
ncbi:MAG: prepilin-type N-terminal cleavage/methylation domain-containing protein [Victivallales bacterium]